MLRVECSPSLELVFLFQASSASFRTVGQSTDDGYVDAVFCQGGTHCLKLLDHTVDVQITFSWVLISLHLDRVELYFCCRCSLNPSVL